MMTSKWSKFVTSHLRKIRNWRLHLFRLHFVRPTAAKPYNHWAVLFHHKCLRLICIPEARGCFSEIQMWCDFSLIFLVDHCWIWQQLIRPATEDDFPISEKTKTQNPDGLFHVQDIIQLNLSQQTSSLLTFHAGKVFCSVKNSNGIPMAENLLSLVNTFSIFASMCVQHIACCKIKQVNGIQISGELHCNKKSARHVEQEHKLFCTKPSTQHVSAAFLALMEQKDTETFFPFCMMHRDWFVNFCGFEHVALSWCHCWHDEQLLVAKAWC